MGRGRQWHALLSDFSPLKRWEMFLQLTGVVLNNFRLGALSFTFTIFEPHTPPRLASATLGM